MQDYFGALWPQPAGSRKEIPVTENAISNGNGLTMIIPVRSSSKKAPDT